MRSIRNRCLVLVVGLCVLQTGCIARQVDKAVREANQEILKATLPGADLPMAGQSSQGWHEAVQNLDNIIKAYGGNPENQKLVQQLRMRQAYVLIAYQQFNLAESVLGAVDGSELSPRDAAFLDLKDTLLFLYQASGKRNEFETNKQELKKSHAAIQKEMANIKSTAPEFHEYLSELQMRVGLFIAQNSDEVEAQQIYASSLTEYANTFTAQEIQAFQSEVPLYIGSLETVRRQTWAHDTIKMARKTDVNDFVNSASLPWQQADDAIAKMHQAFGGKVE